MRSLTLKLVLAFMLTSVAGVALASLFTRQFVTREFDDYVMTQQRTDFVADVSAYYSSNGSWAGVNDWLQNRLINREPRRRPGPPETFGGPPAGRFVLVDSGGNVVVPSKNYALNQAVDQSEIVGGTPLTVNGATVGTVLTPQPTAFRDPAEARYLERTDAALAIAAAVTVGIALVLGVMQARLITKPVREMTAAAQKIAAGDLQQRVPVRSRDELGVLAAQFNHMSADVAQATQLRHQMTADIAHDLRTPLTVISGYLEAMRDRVLAPTPERFATLHHETQLLLRLVEDLHTLSLADAGELTLNRQPVDPRQLLERVAEAYQHVAEQQGVVVRVRGAAPLPCICVDEGRMTRALGNLVSNALRYTPEGGLITLTAQATPAQVQLVVADTGAGIDSEHLPNIFERFYRADQSRTQETGGSGLGLAIVKSIVEAHAGQISVDSAPGQGAAFTIALPGRY